MSGRLEAAEQSLGDDVTPDGGRTIEDGFGHVTPSQSTALRKVLADRYCSKEDQDEALAVDRIVDE